MNRSLQDIKHISRNVIISAIGSDLWDSFDNLTQTGILTSEICLKTLSSSPSGVDFSSSIVPIMKALEHELTNSFYLPYMSFLQEEYPIPDDYIKTNKLVYDPQNNMYPDDQRRKVIRFDSRRKKYYYRRTATKSGNVEFTIGDYRFSVGVDDLSIYICDQTAIDFYKLS